MTEPTPPPGDAVALRPDVAALTLAIATAVLDVAGVAALEPTLVTAGLRGMYRRGTTDGIRVTVKESTVDADVNMATSSSHQARAVAAAVQTRVNQVITVNDYTPNTVFVSVLRVEERPSPLPDVEAHRYGTQPVVP